MRLEIEVNGVPEIGDVLTVYTDQGQFDMIRVKDKEARPVPTNSFHPEWYQPKSSKEEKMSNIYEISIIERVAKSVRIEADSFAEAERILNSDKPSLNVEYTSYEEALPCEITGIVIVPD